MEENETIITIADNHGTGVGNLTIQNVKYFGRPNFAGNPDKFNKMGGKRSFSILIPEQYRDTLKGLGWMVNTLEVRPEFPEEEAKHILKIAVDIRKDPMFPEDVTRERMPDIWVIQGDLPPEKLTSKTVGILDRNRFDAIDIEIRGWEYDREELPGVYSARLVTFVGVMKPSLLGEKYNLLG
jgi:hypothetical protein